MWLSYEVNIIFNIYQLARIGMYQSDQVSENIIKKLVWLNWFDCHYNVLASSM